jgi:hypothetical protein
VIFGKFCLAKVCVYTQCNCGAYYLHDINQHTMGSCSYCWWSITFITSLDRFWEFQEIFKLAYIANKCSSKFERFVMHYFRFVLVFTNSTGSQTNMISVKCQVWHKELRSDLLSYISSYQGRSQTFKTGAVLGQ